MVSAMDNRLAEEIKADKKARISDLAKRILGLSRDHILVNMRFLDVALMSLTLQERTGTGQFCCDGKNLYYDPQLVIRSYQREPAAVIRMYLHILLHFIFYHSFRYRQVDQELWNLAADMAVENTAMELASSVPGMGQKSDLKKSGVLEAMKKEGVMLTAEKLYRHLQKRPPDLDDRMEMERLFFVDTHAIWENTEQLTISLAEWKRLAQRVKADLKTFSQGKNGARSMEENLAEATRDRVDYGAFLKRFVVSGEVLHSSEDEFDYIAYTYGLTHYGNMPIVEPLEYRDEQRIRDFVIAIDTSASCRGRVVRGFLNHTYSIMKTAASFFDEMNVHIIQCDHEVRSDTVIHNQEEFDAFLTGGKLEGFGNTDFRPVFAHVDELIRNGEIQDMKGLIYFTDGHGVYPQDAPDYETVFVFPDDDGGRALAPSWALQIVLDGDELAERVY